MNAFEDLVARCFERNGLWVRQSVKVNISKEDKRRIGTHSMPRPEIDIVACDVGKRELWLVEAKSYFDSPGVRFDAVQGFHRDAKRYKLFTDETFRAVVTKELFDSFTKSRLITEDFSIKYVLVAGNVYGGDEPKIKNYFTQKGWIFWTPDELVKIVRKLSDDGWDDNLVSITSKLLLRKPMSK